MIETAVHLLLHFAVPGLLARWAFPGRWRRAWLIMVATMVVDLDHLLADPVFDPNRCSIGFHPLHSWPAIGLYLVMTATPAARLIGVGLLIHMGLDGLDCIGIP
jgi:hypothetical protein